jgi:hypothetical protein
MKRIRYAVAALVLAAAAIAATGWTPLCALYDPWTPQWIALGCWFGEPDPPTQGS